MPCTSRNDHASRRALYQFELSCLNVRIILSLVRATRAASKLMLTTIRRLNPFYAISVERKIKNRAVAADHPCDSRRTTSIVDYRPGE
jgi:hypothetical protein